MIFFIFFCARDSTCSCMPSKNFRETRRVPFFFFFHLQHSALVVQRMIHSIQGRLRERRFHGKITWASNGGGLSHSLGEKLMFPNVDGSWFTEVKQFSILTSERRSERDYEWIIKCLERYEWLFRTLTTDRRMERAQVCTSDNKKDAETLKGISVRHGEPGELSSEVGCRRRMTKKIFCSFLFSFSFFSCSSFASLIWEVFAL